MKKFFAILISLCMIFGLMACGDSSIEDTEPVMPAYETDTPDETEATEETEMTTEQQEIPIWEINKDLKPATLGSDYKETFEKAVSELDGVNYEPVAVLATQVVAGLNIAYLVKGEDLTQNFGTQFYILFVYKDLKGGAEVTEIAGFDLNVLSETEPLVTGLAGGWNVASEPGSANLDAASKEVFDEAMKSLAGVDIIPIATIGRYTVGAGGYAYLASVTAGDETNIEVLFVMADNESYVVSDMFVINVLDYKE